MRYLLAILLLSCGAHQPSVAECSKRGGAIFTGPATMPPAQQHSACILPAADAGKPCRGPADCTNICACPEPLPARDPDNPGEPIPTKVVGTCSEFPPMSGGGFYCTVENGRAHPDGIIVD